MRVQLLVVAGCPNETLATQRLRQVLDETGHAATDIEVQIVTDENIAGSDGFAGSPTVLIDGIDPFAPQHPSTAGLSCRVYPDPPGMAGAPSINDLRHTIRHTS